MAKERRSDRKKDTNVTIETDEKLTKAPDGGWGWFVVLGCLFLRIVVGGIQRSSGLFYVKFLEKFGGTATETAWVTSLSMTVRLLVGPVVSILCNKYSRRKLSFIGAAVYVVGVHISAYADSLPYLYVSYGLIAGFGRGFVLTPCILILGEYFDKRRSLAFGLASAGFGIGGFAITPLIEVLFQEYGFTGTFIILSGFACNIFICVSLFRSARSTMKEKRINNKRVSILVNGPNSDEEQYTTFTSSTGSVHLVKTDIPKKMENYSDDDEQSESANDSLLDKTSENNKSGKKIDEKKALFSFAVLKDVRFMTLCFATFIFALPSSGLFLPALAKSRGLTDFEAAFLLSVIAGCDTVSRVASGFILDLKRLRPLRPAIYNAISYAQCLAAFILPSLNTFGEFVAVCCLHGAVMGVKAAQRSVILVDILGVDNLSSSFALLLGFQGVGTLVGPPLAGLLKDHYGKYDYSFYFGGSAILFGSTILLCGNIRNFYNNRRIKREKEKSLTES